jgi:hypothetical protein
MLAAVNKKKLLLYLRLLKLTLAKAQGEKLVS